MTELMLLTITNACLTGLFSHHRSPLPTKCWSVESSAPSQVRGAILPDYAPPGLTVTANVGIEVTQEYEVFPGWALSSTPNPNPKDSKKDGYAELVFGP